MPSTVWLYAPLVEKALRTAAIAHAGQTRKASELPYLVHPTAVAMILVHAGFTDPVVLAAALLHDVVEDTPVSLDELRTQFPENVVAIVDVLTEKKCDESGARRPWRLRKEEKLGLVANSAVDCRAVFLADKRHNLEAIRTDLESGEPVWERFNAGREDVLQQYRQAIDAVAHGDERLVRLGEECRRTLEAIEASGP